MLQTRNLTLITNFRKFTPTSLQHLTRLTPSHGILTPPTTAPKTTPPPPVLALSSILLETENATVYSTTVRDLQVIVKELPKCQEVLAHREASINSNQLSKFSSDVVPKFFGIFTDEEGLFYLLFEYAGEATLFEELSRSER